MAIQVISKIAQKNNMKFKLMDAQNVSYDGTEQISIKDKIDEAFTKIDTKSSINIQIADTVPPDQKTGDIWIESI